MEYCMAGTLTWGSSKSCVSYEQEWLPRKSSAYCTPTNYYTPDSMASGPSMVHIRRYSRSLSTWNRLAPPTHIIFWDIRRAFDSIPGWLQRLPWAKLGLSTDDLEGFLNLDELGRITIRTPHQQSRATRTTDMMSTDAMIKPLGNAFHLERALSKGILRLLVIRRSFHYSGT